MSEPPAATKRPYKKPYLYEVPLRPEEAVLGTCKSAGISGPIQPTCAVPITCSSQGS